MNNKLFSPNTVGGLVLIAFNRCYVPESDFILKIIKKLEARKLKVSVECVARQKIRRAFLFFFF